MLSGMTPPWGAVLLIVLLGITPPWEMASVLQMLLLPCPLRGILVWGLRLCMCVVGAAQVRSRAASGGVVVMLATDFSSVALSTMTSGTPSSASGARASGEMSSVAASRTFVAPSVLIML